MFNASLRFNCDPTGDVPPAEIERLLSEAGLGQLLERDTADGKGIETMINEGGSNLSAGEKQLICIVRAILRKNKIIVLDEATANIDVVTEQKIQEMINTQFKDSTVLTIAHRLQTIIQSDRIAVVDSGRVVEFGTPDELREDSSTVFYKLI